MPFLSREDRKALARVKREDAAILFAQSRYSNACYLYGYAVELGLKACVSIQFPKHAFPDRKLVQQIFTHGLRDLLGPAGLVIEHKTQTSNDPRFRANWAIVVEWSEESRYEMIDVVKATAMRNAVEDEDCGAIAWLQKHG